MCGVCQTWKRMQRWGATEQTLGPTAEDEQVSDRCLSGSTSQTLLNYALLCQGLWIVSGTFTRDWQTTTENIMQQSDHRRYPPRPRDILGPARRGYSCTFRYQGVSSSKRYLTTRGTRPEQGGYLLSRSQYSWIPRPSDPMAIVSTWGHVCQTRTLGTETEEDGIEAVGGSWMLQTGVDKGSCVYMA